MNAGPPRDRPLGRGLTALLGEDRAADAPAGESASSKTVGIDLLRPNRLQPRRDFDEAQLDSLGESIRAQGLLQPILVRRDPDRAGGYEIVAGERRWRAAQRARLHEVPVLVREVPDRAALEIAIVENVQRQDLNPVEEARGPIRRADGFLVLMVCGREAPEAVFPSPEEVEEQLRAELIGRRAERYLLDLRRAAVIDLRL